MSELPPDRKSALKCLYVLPATLGPAAWANAPGHVLITVAALLVALSLAFLFKR